MHLPEPVQTVVETYLEMVDAYAPALLEGLYLVGSIALGDFRPHRSDIDFIAVMSKLPQGAHLTLVERTHTQIQQRWSKPFFDGVYVTWDDLAADPTQLDPRPSAHEGYFDPGTHRSTDPVAWHTLAQSGLRMRGPEPVALQIWRDRAVLDAWTDANLDDYWQRRMLDRGARLLSRVGLGELTAWACEWCVTVVSRLHYTLASGAITSKEGAALYAHNTFTGRWTRVIEESLRIRRASPGRSLYRSPLSRRRDVRAFTQFVITDAHRIYNDRYRHRTEQCCLSRLQSRL